MPEIDELSMHIYTMNMLHFLDIMHDMGSLSKEEYIEHVHRVMTAYIDSMSRISKAKTQIAKGNIFNMMNSKGRSDYGNQ